MRGRPIDEVTRADLDQLISDGVAEDRRLEFKLDVSVSAEEQKIQLKATPGVRPIDRSWTRGQRLPDFGRDALAEEVVAFANAAGGTVILGMEETKEAPPRAKAINPLPDVAGLERRLRDVLLSCIEPRLPYVAVRGLPTEPDGSGVVLIETAGSVSGPHWVLKTRKPTIRREDRCDPLTMTEVHDMVLRNSRGMDNVLRQSENARTQFVRNFEDGIRRFRSKSSQNMNITDLNYWLSESGLGALGAQAVVTPHYELGIPRIENMDGLIPSGAALSVEQADGLRQAYYADTYTYASNYSSRILGGVIAIQDGSFYKTVRILRNGQITVSFMFVNRLERCTCSADLIAGIAGVSLGIFDRLRRRSNYPAAPAELSIDICARQAVGVGGYEGIGFSSSYGRLEQHTRFPSYTMGSKDDITQIIQDLSSDLMNAGGMPASHLPKIIWNDPH